MTARPETATGPRRGQAAAAAPAASGSGILPGLGSRGQDGGDGGPRPRRRHGRWLAPVISLLVLLVIVGSVGTYLYSWYSAKHANYSGEGYGQVTIQVKPGDFADNLVPQLLSMHVIKASEPFMAAAKANNPTGLQPGYFRLHRHMNAALAWAALLNPKNRIQTTVTIPDGQRLSSILPELARQTGIKVSAFEAAAKDTGALGLPAYAHGSLEGYLYPDTYNFAPGVSAHGVLQEMVSKFNSVATSLNLQSRAKTVNLTPGQVITIASLLEAEGTPKYYGQIARVIDNRLNIKMFLGLDTTVLYALHKSGFKLSPQQLKVNSPYNTFIHKGLPPGPIDNPTAAAIHAALNPPKGNWLYFITVDPKKGITKFTSSYHQFLRFQAECRANNAC